MKDSKVRLESTQTCHLCGEAGLTLYRSLQDRRIGVEGLWNEVQCGGCGLIWLNPRPVARDIGHAYVGYFSPEKSDMPRSGLLTSIQDKAVRAILSADFSYDHVARSELEKDLGAVLRYVPSLRDYVGTRVMFLESMSNAHLLDVGCGDGRFLARMRLLGWNVLGVETDTEAARIARERRGVDVIEGTLEEASLKDAAFDVITLSHVIEHVHQPLVLLAECYRLLKPGGRLVILTPNAESLGHKFFRHRWGQFDPPRHLHLFSKQTLLWAVERLSFRIKEVRTISRFALTVWIYSRIKGPSYSWRTENSLATLIAGVLFSILEESLRILDDSVGEELLIVAFRDK